MSWLSATRFPAKVFRLFDEVVGFNAQALGELKDGSYGRLTLIALQE